MEEFSLKVFKQKVSRYPLFDLFEQVIGKGKTKNRNIRFISN